MSILSSINSPEDVKKLKPEQLPDLAYEIRQQIIDVTSQKGGHVSPNLGIVELSIALHRVFDTPKDQILFDVSHQCYTHKLLTGRNNEKFRNLRQTGGIRTPSARGMPERRFRQPWDWRPRAIKMEPMKIS